MNDLTMEEQKEIARHILEEAKKNCLNCQEFVCDGCVYKEWRRYRYER